MSEEVIIKRGRFKNIDQVLDELVTLIQRRQIRGSSAVARHTANLLRNVINAARYKSIGELLATVRYVGKTLQSANPVELAIGNITRRVLFIIRQEVAEFKKKQQQGLEENDRVNVDLSRSLHTLLDADDGVEDDEISVQSISKSIIAEISELVEEVNSVTDQIADLAVEHVHAHEIILTFGVSRTVIKFFHEVAKLRKFQVYVVESAPSFSGQSMAVQLAKLGIETTVITEAAVFAMMAAVNKVVFGTHVVMANGGLITYTGAHNIAAAAKAHSVPVVCIAGLYKLCPLYAFDQDTFNELQLPSEILQYEDAWVEKVKVINPAYDYVAPELVSLFVTNFGGHNPSYIYRLLAEYYDPEDYEL